MNLTANPAPTAHTPRTSWPTWGKILASLGIGWQIVSLIAAELTSGPSSPLEHQLAGLFSRYFELTDQGIGHRFYSDIGPTPILWAEVRFKDGSPPATVRLPDRKVRPRLLYQRQLALANAVFMEFGPRLADPDLEVESAWAKSFARHLSRLHPGCEGVKVRIQMHRNPEPGRVIAGLRGEAPRADPDSDEFHDVPVTVGDYPCDTP